MLLEILFLIIIGFTFIVFILHNIFKNKKNIFAKFIDKIWAEWFEDQWKAILAFALIIFIFIIIGMIWR